MSDDIERPSLGKWIMGFAAMAASAVVGRAVQKAMKPEDLWLYVYGVLALATIGFLIHLLEWKLTVRKRTEPQRRRDVIERAIHDKWGTTPGAMSWSTITNGTNFHELSLNDFSETRLFQDVPKPLIAIDIRRQIRFVSNYLERSDATGYQSVTIVVVVWKFLNSDKKHALASQLDALKKSDALSSKINFQLWDRSNL